MDGYDDLAVIVKVCNDIFDTNRAFLSSTQSVEYIIDSFSLLYIKKVTGLYSVQYS
jgi:hypothetical protein